MLEAAVTAVLILLPSLFWLKLSIDMYAVWSRRTIWWRAVAVALIAPPVMLYGELERALTHWTTR